MFRGSGGDTDLRRVAPATIAPGAIPTVSTARRSSTTNRIPPSRDRSGSACEHAGRKDAVLTLSGGTDRGLKALLLA